MSALEPINPIPLQAREAREAFGGGSAQALRSDGAYLAELARIVRRRLKLLLATMAIVTPLVFLVLMSAKPLYTASATLMVNPAQQNIIPESERPLASDGGFSTFIDSQVELLKTPFLAGRLVDTMKLVEDPAWNAKAQAHRKVGRPADAAERQNVVETVSRRIAVSRQQQSSLIKLSVQAPSARQAAELANKLTALYFETQIKGKIEQAEQADAWLDQRIAALKAEVMTKEAAVVEFRSSAGLLTTGGPSLPDQQVRALETSIITAQTDLAERQARESQLSSMLARGGSVDSLPNALSSEVIRELRTKEADIARRQSEMSHVYGDKHPDVVKARSERADIQLQINQEMQRIATGVGNEVEVAAARLHSLQETAASLKQDMSSNTGPLLRLQELERDAAAARSVYEGFLSRRQQISDQQSLKSTDGQVVAPASIPFGKSTPKPSLSLLLALAAGLAIGFVVVLLRELSQDVLNNVEDVETKVGLAQLASLPSIAPRHIDRQSGSKLYWPLPADLMIAQPTSRFAEAISFLRTTLIFGAGAHPPRVVAITSALPNEGKTNCALALARSVALARERVVIVDCDLRQRALSRSHPVPKFGGLEQVLLGEADWRAVCSMDQSGATLIGSAGDRSIGREMLRSERMSALIAELRENFDLVVLDCPPVLPVANALLIARHADACVMMANWAKTPAKAVVSAVDRLQQVGAVVAGVVLNNVVVESRGRLSQFDPEFYSRRYANLYSD